MLYPGNLEEKLGFDQIRHLLHENCQSVEGRKRVDSMRFSSRMETVDRHLRQSAEMVKLTEEGTVFTLPPLEVRAQLPLLKVEGAYLEGTALLEVADALAAALKIAETIGEEEPHLLSLSSMIHFDLRLPVFILQKFDPKGELRDSASPQLHKLRNELKKASQGIRGTLKKIFQQAQHDGLVPENSQPTFRDGRFVIPVKAANKRVIKGFIHDESATGQTVYLEPSEVLETNNRLVELYHQEKRECIRIFKEISDRVRQELEAVDHAFEYLGLIDFIHAKSMLAHSLQATMPELEDRPSLKLLDARHPLLDLNFRKEKRKIIPLTLSLVEGESILLISGPNAGGKSVCLKTVGLLQYMLQCGLLVPVEADSHMGLFSKIFVDLGDEQSLENDLSTYSSHLTNMRVMLKNADHDSLLLIDEFGTGTDPAFGGAIAEAILEQLVEKSAFGVITTHYGNLKEWAQAHDGIRNAAMLFDAKKLEPLYQLELDRPGSSFALEVANSIGLPKQVVAKAKELVGASSVEVEQLINKLSSEKKELEDRLSRVRQQEAELKKSLNEFRQKSDQLDEKKEVILQKARAEAKQLLESTNRQIEKTIRHIKENKAQKTETKKIRQKLDSFKTTVTPKKADRKKEPGIERLPGKIAVGDYVWNEQSQLSGEVLGINGNKVKLAIGELQTHVKLELLHKVRKPITKQSSYKKPTVNLAQKQSTFRLQLDVRGLRAEEVSPELERYIDDALLLGHHEVKVLHGKGNGVLRQVVRDVLRGYEQVVRVQDEDVERGGAGISVITLK